MRHLGMSCYNEHDNHLLPMWMSQLTQLDSLREGAAVTQRQSEFVVILLRLKQLSSLDLSHTDFAGVDFPDEVVHFSEFTGLTNLGMCWVQSSSRAHQQLTNMK